MKNNKIRYYLIYSSEILANECETATMMTMFTRTRDFNGSSQVNENQLVGRQSGFDSTRSDPIRINPWVFIEKLAGPQVESSIEKYFKKYFELRHDSDQFIVLNCTSVS